MSGLAKATAALLAIAWWNVSRDNIAIDFIQRSSRQVCPTAAA
jgi:hypothetical protein